MLSNKPSAADNQQEILSFLNMANLSLDQEGFGKVHGLIETLRDDKDPRRHQIWLDAVGIDGSFHALSRAPAGHDVSPDIADINTRIALVLKEIEGK